MVYTKLLNFSKVLPKKNNTLSVHVKDKSEIPTQVFSNEYAKSFRNNSSGPF